MNLSLQAQVHVAVPGNALMDDVPLVAVLRGGFVGSLHRGSFALADPSGRLLVSAGNPTEQVFLRSAAKPFQAMPAVLSSALDRFGISERELAVLCASHSGEGRHLEAVLSVLSKAGLEEGALQCGAHPPLNETSARQRARAGIEPTPVCNNCSGAHAGMLLACRAEGWSTSDYGRPDHPLQRRIRAILASFAGAEEDDIDLATDNCAVPTFRLPLLRAAQAFARLASGQALSDDLAGAARRIVKAMTDFPEMVGGEGRFDTDLMRATGGSVVAKGGAEAFQGVGIIHAGAGLALKISDGGARAVPPVTMRVLHHLEALDRSASARLAPYAEPELHSMLGEPVGRLVPVFHFGGSP